MQTGKTIDVLKILHLGKTLIPRWPYKDADLEDVQVSGLIPLRVEAACCCSSEVLTESCCRSFWSTG